MVLKHHKKLVIRTTAIAGTLLVCGSVLTSSPAIMHADETPSTTDTTTTHSENTTTTPTTTIDGSKWTAVDKAKTITRTIHYVDENGKAVAPDNVTTITGQIYSQSGTNTKRAFTIINGAATNTIPKFATVTSPSIKGYTLKNTVYSKIPEQSWSLDATQPKDANGFYTNLTQDEVINVVYQKDASTELKNAVPVSGYTVLDVKTMSRTINYVDAEGKRLATSKVESVKYETVASNKLTASEQQKKENQKIAVVKETKDKAGNIINQSTQILTTPSYKLKDVKSPIIKGYKLQNSKFKTLSGQYMWFSTDPYVHATLDNGLPQFMVQDEIVDVVYVPSKQKTKKNTHKTTDPKKKGTVAVAGKDSNNDSGSSSSVAGSTDGTSATGSTASTASGDGDIVAAGSTDAGDGSSDIGSSSSYDGEVELPQTGNTKSSSALLGSGVAMLLSSFAFAWDGLKKKFTR